MKPFNKKSSILLLIMIFLFLLHISIEAKSNLRIKKNLKTEEIISCVEKCENFMLINSNCKCDTNCKENKNCCYDFITECNHYDINSEFITNKEINRTLLNNLENTKKKIGISPLWKYTLTPQISIKYITSPVVNQ